MVTKNALKSAPARRTEDLLRQKGPLRAVVVNTKFANDLTGRQGRKDTDDTASWAAKGLHVPAEQVLVHSTGVIGVPVPRPKIKLGVSLGVKALSAEGGAAFSRAILTTDSVAKLSHRSLPHGMSLVGFAKGSGMIDPNLATMLVYVLTDVAISRNMLDRALRDAVAVSFNRITVDGDTSPSDSVVVLANGAAGTRSITKDGPEYRDSPRSSPKCASNSRWRSSATARGATKFITVAVTGAKNESDALLAAKAIAHSPLVKTAIFGTDPNWGRILTAVGYSGAAVDEFKAKGRSVVTGCTTEPRAKDGHLRA